MTIVASDFTTNFPEFSNAQKYPPSVINYYLTLAYIMLNPDRWGPKLLDHGAQLFMAHNLVLEYLAQVAASKGAAPGIATGAIASQGAGPLSMGWDTGSSAEPGAGHWNTTTYGQRYIRLCRLMGAGGVQLGIGRGGNPLDSSNAWVGPPPWPGWFSS